MQRPTASWLLAALPGLLVSTYLAVHATEGWQLLVVGAFLSGFAVSCLRNSKALLVVSYLATAGLFAWVLSVNI